jgi:hypothetical protein
MLQNYYDARDHFWATSNMRLLLITIIRKHYAFIDWWIWKMKQTANLKTLHTHSFCCGNKLMPPLRAHLKLFLWKARLLWPRWYDHKLECECILSDYYFKSQSDWMHTRGYSYWLPLIIQTAIIYGRDNWNCFTAGVPSAQRAAKWVKHRAWVQLYTWMTTVRQAAEAANAGFLPF